MTSLFLNHTSCVAKEPCHSHSASSLRQQYLPHLLQGEYKSCESQMINMPTKLMWHTDNQCESMTEGNIRKRNLTNQNIASYQLPFCDDIKMYFQVLMMIYVSIFNHIYMFFTIDWAQRRCYWQCNIQTMQRTQAADLFPAIDKYWMTMIQYTTTIHFIQVNRWHTLICIFQMVLLV